MDREEASRALELLKRVVSQARDDSALQNWGVIWMIHGVLNGGGFAATNQLVLRGVNEPWPYALMWGAIIGLDLLMVLALRRRTGASSFVETQLWSIWLTFIAATALTAVLNHLMGLKTFFLGPVIGVLSAMGFSMMGALMGRRWYIASAIFTAATIAMALVPKHQFTILGVVWGLSQFAGGIWLHGEKRKRLAAGAQQGARLV